MYSIGKLQREYIYRQKNEHSKQLMAAGFLFIIFVTFIYWWIDVYLIELPDPVIPYIFIILFYTIFFGVKYSLFISILTIIIIIFLLFEPRYSLNPYNHLLSIIFTFIGLVFSLIFGDRIRRYQQMLILKSKELQELILLRDRFVSIAAHDLKNPIASIKLYSQMLNTLKLDTKSQKTLLKTISTIQRETDKMLELINILLDYSRLQSGKMELKKKTFDIQDLCAQKVQLHQKLFSSHIFIFNKKIKSALINADEIAVDRIITNLLTNAANYSQANTKIILILKKQKKFYTIIIKDKGKGMTREQQNKLFEPFYQVDSKQGLGLGLYITKSLVELHHGKIHVKSVINIGSTFTVHLPAG